MTDFLQLNAKGKEPGAGLFSMIVKQAPMDGNESPIPLGALKQKVGEWLAEDNELTDFRLHDVALDPHQFVDAITRTVNKRACLVAGHAWLEFMEGESDEALMHGWADADVERLNLINVTVVEFLPRRLFDPDKVFVALKTNGDPLLWSKVTDGELRRLFSELFIPSVNNRVPAPKSKRHPLGYVPGHVIVIWRQSLTRYSSEWLREFLVDRSKAFVTPGWKANEPGKAVRSLVGQNSELNYSFTPEHYRDTENCASFASHCLDELVEKDWLEVLTAQCHIDKNSLEQMGHDPYNVRECGWMKSVLAYCSRAHETRDGGRGLKNFV